MGDRGALDAEQQAPPPQAGRRKVRHVSMWARNAMKRLQAEGQAHINTTGQVVPKRTTGPVCRCRRECFKKLTADQQALLLSSFNELGDKEKQDVHLSGLMTMQPITRRRQQTGQGRPKVARYQYKVAANVHFTAHASCVHIISIFPTRGALDKYIST